MITKNYIKMREKAEEIQKDWKPKNGDYIYFLNSVGVIIMEPSGNWSVFSDKIDLFAYSSIGNNYMKDSIWLPTQEQLQEMILDNPNADFQPLWLLNKFKMFTDTINIGSLGTGIEDSFNELWLAFVMKEKYNKIWNGKDWIRGSN